MLLSQKDSIPIENRILTEKPSSKITQENRIAGFPSMNISDVREKDLWYLLNKGHLGVISHKNSFKSIESAWW